MMKSVVAALCVLSLAAPAAAETKVSGKRSKSDKRLQCRSTAEIGSRLTRKRVCLTAAEWRDLQQQTRTELDKAQGMKPVNGQ